ncbi:hypothetical protein HNY73_005851 [Argiope bruennichi]|uniref:Uncharacterized protein n=1 Tax=Argiope bruennichi TaxID=94029 RepID=A0A8T0FKK6_ARGBR|nr:hypothetical protein HNY73_005851 [Argiope bruennichi]
MSITDRELLDQINRDLEFKNGRYEAKLLWRTDPSELENNFNLAKRQFDELKKGFNKNEWIASAYGETIQETNGIIKECGRDRNEYFMPHRAVVRADKETTKVRMVFNCGSKSGQNLSLNDCLEAGPNLNPSILEVIMKFRRLKVALHGDIEKMTRLPFGCKTSPFILSAVIKHHIAKFEAERPDSVLMLNSGLYINDLYFGADSMMETFTLSSDAVTILRSGGFKLRKLRSNNSDLRALWVKNGFCESEGEGVELKVLGLIWNPNKDVLSLEAKGLVDSLRGLDDTKRCALQTAARIFDAVELIAPIVDCGKGLAEIHIFCEASLRAYGATSYTRYVDNTGKCRVSFLMSKNRVAPLKTLTLPRLELIAAVIGVRLAKFLEGIYYKIVGKFMFWTDSQIVLYWIRGNAKRWKQLEANRVAEVQEKSNPNDWFYCPSAENPADLLTRGVFVENLISSQKWWYGPNWLLQNCNYWPEKSVKQSQDVGNSEILREQKADSVVCFVVKVDVIEELWNKISVWSRFQSVVAWRLKFVGNCRENMVSIPYLECLDLKESHDRIIHLVQKVAFSTETSVLEKGNVLSAGKLIQLNPFLDSKGLLRVGEELETPVCQRV